MYDSIVNTGEFLSAHWLDEVFPAKLKTLSKQWGDRDDAGEVSVHKGLCGVAGEYTRLRIDCPDARDPGYAEALTALHSRLLEAMGYDANPQTLHTFNADTEVRVPLLVRAQANGGEMLHVLQALPVDSDDELLSDDALLLAPIVTDPDRERPTEIRTVAEAVQLLFLVEDAPRFVLVVAGNWVLLTDAQRWAEGRYLAFDLETALGRRDTKAAGELAWHAGMWSADVLLPAGSGEAARIVEFSEDSVKHAVGVSADLREGLRRSVELIANEVLAQRRAAGLQVEGIDELPGEITAQSLRFLYRILFLLFAEARPELGILPVGAPEYGAGYGIDRLRELVQVPMSVRAGAGSHFHDSLDVLFRLVNEGHGHSAAVIPGQPPTVVIPGERPSTVIPGERPSTVIPGERPTAVIPGERPSTVIPGERSETRDLPPSGIAEGTPGTPHSDLTPGDPGAAALRASGREDGGDGLVFESLQADLFSPARANLIDSIRIRNSVLQRVLELLLLSKQTARKGRQRGYVSYAQLGINQLGAVYEGLMAYTGFIAERDLIELAKDGDPAKGTWMVPAEEVGRYDPKHLVKRQDANGSWHNVVHKQGSFVYRLAGRDRQRSASYYTPEVLTRCVVKHALAELISEDTAAADILEYRVCEPALGSGAFANEAINQLATEYLHRRQRECDRTIDPADYQDELAKVKAWIALHRVYGVDLNATAVELAEVSMWLNVMHPGLRAPWFGLHLRRGNSLIGARRATYDLASTNLRKGWHSTPPTDRHLAARDGEAAITGKQVHHFLLPAAGWGAAGDAKEAKELVKPRADALRNWAKSTRATLTAAETNRAVGLATRVERLWALTLKRLEISEHEIARTIDVWEHPNPQAGGGVPRAAVESAVADPDSPYQRLRLAMDAWCALYFWPVTEGTPNPPTRDEWLTTLEGLLGIQGKADRNVDQTGLHDLTDDFHTLGQLDADEAGWYDMRPVAELIAATPWLAVARAIAEREGFFHWELDFAQVFARGGFDLQVGNPPWVRPVWQDDVILAEFDPYFMLVDKIPTKEFAQRRADVLAVEGGRERYLAEVSSQAGMVSSLGSAVEHEVLAGVQINLYMAFMERVWRSSGRPSGAIGLLHPEGHFNDPKAGRFRAEAYRRLRRHWQFSNEGMIFEDILHKIEFGIHVYGPERDPAFRQIAYALYPATVDASLVHDGSGEPPGLKLLDGNWDVRPHASRVVQVDERVLGQWAALFDEPGTPALQARLLRPIVREHLDAIAALAAYPTRMGDVGYQWTSGWHEKGAKEDGTIFWDTRTPASWDEAILQGPHFFVATPFYKQPNQPCTSNLDYNMWDLEGLPESVIPRTNYQRACDRSTYGRGIPQWFGKPATEHYRLAWRRMTHPSLQRTLTSSLVPPGPMHVDAVNTLAMSDPRATVAASAVWSCAPLDFLYKVAGVSKINGELLGRLPSPEGPAVPPMLLRTLRLNCLTNAYADLWSEVWDDAFRRDSWTSPFAHLPPLNAVTPEWSMATPLRTDESRRAALVEIDALAALMLGLTADQLVAMYTGQMAVMRKYEYGMWFDANHRVIARDNAAKGAKQREDDFRNLQAYLAGEPCGDLLERYAPPFHQPDREAEMRAAYSQFQQRLGL